MDPFHVVGQSSVNPILPPLATALAEASDAEDGPAVFRVRTKQGTPRVPGTRVSPASPVARAEHVPRNMVVFIHPPTLFVGHYRHLDNRNC